MGFISRTFLKGLLTLFPIALTLYLLIWTATTAETSFGIPLKTWFPEPFYFPGAGVFVVAVLVFLFGLLVNSYFTHRFFGWLEKRVERMPVIGSIYTPLRDLTQLFARQENGAGQRVVMVRIETTGLEVIGLVTRDQFRDLPVDMVPPEHVAVFLPFSYGVGGVTAIVPKKNIRETTLSADRALQLAITGWIKSTK